MQLKDVKDEELGKIQLTIPIPTWFDKTFTPMYKYKGKLYGHGQNGQPHAYALEATNLWEIVSK